MAIQIAEQDVRERADALWEARGRPEGSASEDWFAAKLQLKAELDAVSTPLEPLAQEAAEVLEGATKESPRAVDDTALVTKTSSARTTRKRVASPYVAE